MAWDDRPWMRQSDGPLLELWTQVKKQLEGIKRRLGKAMEGVAR